jgi:hypothetical protein
MGLFESFLLGFEKAAAKWQKEYSSLSPESQAKLAPPGTPAGAVAPGPAGIGKMSPHGEGTVVPAAQLIRGAQWGYHPSQLKDSSPPNPDANWRSNKEFVSRLSMKLKSKNLGRRLQEQYPPSAIPKWMRPGVSSSPGPTTVPLPSGEKAILLPSVSKFLEDQRAKAENRLSVNPKEQPPSWLKNIKDRREEARALDMVGPAHEGAEASYPTTNRTVSVLQKASKSRAARKDLTSVSYPGSYSYADKQLFLDKMMQSRHGVPALAHHAGVRPYLAEVSASYGEPESFMAMSRVRSKHPVDAAAYAKMKQMGMTPWNPLPQDPKREAQLQQGIRPVTRAEARSSIAEERKGRAEAAHKKQLAARRSASHMNKSPGAFERLRAAFKVKRFTR